MPKMNGLEAIRQIKAKTPRVRIIALSMYPDMETKALAAGADAFAGKGESPEELRRLLEQVVRER